MKTSTDRILTTHVGSIARPKELAALLDAQKEGKVDQAEFDRVVCESVRRVVEEQARAGISIINDGEQSKPSFSTYVRQRFSGFAAEESVPMPISLDEREYPNWGYTHRKLAPCVAPIAWQDFSAVEKDIANLKDAVRGVTYEEVFMTSVSPGTVANFFPNRFYKTRSDYMAALAEAMSREYKAIVDAGFIVQVDCPDLALRNFWFPDHTIPEFRDVIADNVQVLNESLSGIPKDKVRLHICWGASETPKSHDVPLRAIVDIVLKANVGAISFVGANGAHEHEYKVWTEVDLPDDLILIPGVVDNTTNIIEHPDWVAERIVRYANIVGRARVIAGLDCGFGTGSSIRPHVDPLIAIAKLKALSEGAQRASQELW
ncbi:MAG TPA: cobalamin-independent methionine synthase II family protein [Dehalococcoidia bacterium]|nr:cobalamin-independent methionine synthase II family protein [Dehalococcoidia bacterium]